MVVCAAMDLPGVLEDGSNLLLIDRTFHKADGVEQQILKQAKAQLYSHIQLPLAVFDGGSKVIDTMDRLLMEGGQAVQREYKKAAFSPCKDTPIKLAALGNDAGIYGAAKLVC